MWRNILSLLGLLLLVPCYGETKEITNQSIREFLQFAVKSVDGRWITWEDTSGDLLTLGRIQCLTQHHKGFTMEVWFLDGNVWAIRAPMTDTLWADFATILEKKLGPADGTSKLAQYWIGNNWAIAGGNTVETRDLLREKTALRAYLFELKPMAGESVLLVLNRNNDLVEQTIVMAKPKVAKKDKKTAIKSIEFPGPVSSSGTGFFVNAEGYIVTAAHVVAGKTRIWIRQDDLWIPAQLVASDTQIDIAVIQVDSDVPAVLRFSDKDATLGSSVHTVGYPNIMVQGFSPKFTRGDISATTGLRDSPLMYQISVPVQPGNSGGPLTDENDNVVGVIAARLDDNRTMMQTGSVPQNVNYAIKASVTLEFLQKVNTLKLGTAFGKSTNASVLIITQ